MGVGLYTNSPEKTLGDRFDVQCAGASAPAELDPGDSAFGASRVSVHGLRQGLLGAERRKELRTFAERERHP